MTRWRIAMPTLALGICALALASPKAVSPAQPAIDAAFRLYQAGNLKDAASAYRKALATDPGHVGGWRDLGLCLHAMGQDAEAFKIWGNLLRLDPSDHRTLNAAGETRLERHEWKEAIRFLSKSLELEPDQVHIRIRLGEAHEGLDGWSEASRIYENLLRKDPDDMDVRLHLVRVREEQGKLKEAANLLEPALGSHPSDERLNHAFARIQGRLGDEAFQKADYPEARKAFQTALSHDPKNQRLNVSLGWVFRKEGNLAEAVQAWTRALETPEAATPNLVRALAEVKLEQGELVEARKLFERARLMVPGEPSPCLNLAEIGLLSQDPDLPETSLRALLSIPKLDPEWADRSAELFIRHEQLQRGVSFFRSLPEDAPGRNQALARILSGQAAQESKEDRLDSAIRLWNDALAADPQNRQALRDLGWVYSRKGDWEGCAKTWALYAQRYPDLSEAHDLCAQALMNRRDYKGAIREERLALARDPEFFQGRLRLLRALVQDGQVSEAKDISAQLVKTHPEDLPVLYRHAEVLTKLAQHAEARDVWATIMRLDPDALRPAVTWLRESYQAEDYDSALAKARDMAKTSPAPEAVLLFLAQDAEIREDIPEVIVWYRRLTQEYGEKSEYWVSLERYVLLQMSPEEGLRIAEEGLKRFPGSVTHQINYAEMLMANHRSQEAAQRLLTISQANPGNARVSRSLVESLLDAHRFRQAKTWAEQNRRESFATDFERTQWEANSLSGMGEFTAAEKLLKEASHPTNGARYVPIILYHGVLGQQRSPQISPSKLDEQLEAVEKAGYTPLTFPELVRIIDGRLPWPERPLLITFDDARTDSFVNADPILAKHHLKATMFVPTMYSVADEDLFHASWKSMRHYSETGRWSLQGHSFEAHDPMVVDAQGHTGVFLADRAWNPDLKRPESDREFEVRVDNDYRQCRTMIEENIPGDEVLAYAFPYSEEGQTNAEGVVPEANDVNDRTWRKYFRFAMVQNSSGWNSIRPGENGSRLFWRFEPPRNWSGEQLLEHLAGSDPRVSARIELARLHLGQGYPEQARRELEALEQEIPAVRPRCQAALADVAWQESQPREAARHLAAVQQSDVAKSLEDSVLAQKLPWENDLRMGVGTRILDGSDGRSREHDFLQATIPFQAPLDLQIQMGRLRMKDKGSPALTGRDAEGRLSWAPAACFDASAWLRRREFDGVENRTFGGFRLHGIWEIQDLSLDAGQGDPDSAAAVREGIDRRDKSLTYRLHGGRWAFRIGVAESTLSDENWIRSGNARLLYQFGGLEGWQFGLDTERASSRFQTASYYAPDDFRSLRACVRYQTSFRNGSALDGEGAFGRSDDAVNHYRWTGMLNLHWTQVWTSRFRSSLGVALGSTTGYRSTQSDFTMEWRF